MDKNQSYKNWKQDDPRFNQEEAWPSSLFPKADYRYFEEAGCLVTSLAIMLRMHNVEKETCEERFNPWILNKRLIDCKAFLPAADLNLSLINRLYPIEYHGSIQYSKDILPRLLEKGAMCLLTIRGTIFPTHFLVLDSILENDVLVIDPIRGSRLLSEYDAAYTIRVFYKAADSKLEESSSPVKPRIAITFDDGPNPFSTDRILTALKSVGGRATFFVLGELVEENKELLARMVKEGHQIGNHTWGHIRQDRLSADGFRESIQRTNDAVHKACGATPALFRPPEEVITQTGREILKDMGLPIILWNVDPRDWQTRDASKTVDYVLYYAWDGDIILLHDIYKQTAEAVEIILPALVKRGFDLVTIEELCRQGNLLQPGMVLKNAPPLSRYM